MTGENFKMKERNICLKQRKRLITNRGNGLKNVKVPDYTKAELLRALAVFIQIKLVIRETVQ